MAAEFDVPARQAEGRPAVASLQHRAHACHRLGHQHPDLTVRAAQLTDGYGREDGMDLAALRDDWFALDDVARAAQDALAVQDRQLAVFRAAWQGAGAEICRDFLRRHGEASAAAEALVRTARDALGALRESLWRSVDVKVDAVVEIESRAQAQQADFLAAAATTTADAGDRAVAAELVDQAVMSIQNAMDSLTEAYQRAVAEIAAEHRPSFDLPSNLGTIYSTSPGFDNEAVVAQQPPVMAPADAAAPAMTAPAAWNPTPSVAPETPAAAPVPLTPPASTVPLPGGMATGTTDFGPGLAGVGRDIAEMLSGLLGSTDNAAAGASGIGAPDTDDPPGLDEVTEADEVAEEDEGDLDSAVEETGEEGADEAEPEADPAEEVDDEPVEAALGSGPVSTPVPPPTEPLPPAVTPPVDAVAVEQTPCEIAAEELPQVGDPLQISEPGAG